MIKKIPAENIIKNIIKYILAAVLLCVIVFAVYQYQPVFKIKFGEGSDRIYLTNAYQQQTRIDGKSYRQIHGVTMLSLPDMGYNLKYKITLNARSGEPPENPQQFLVYLNKKKVADTPLSHKGAEIKFDFSEGKLKGPILFFQFVNEGEKEDPPKIILLENLKIEPRKTKGFVLPPAALLWRLSLTLILLTAAAAVCHRKAAVWTAAFFIVASSAALLFKRIYFLPFTETLQTIASAALIFTILLRLLLPPVLKKLRLNPVLDIYKYILLLLFAGFVIRAVLCLYPGTIISDIDFHAHRMGAVYNHGQIFQTSTTPDEKYSFPYPTLLYILLVPVRFITSLPHAVILRWAITLIDSLIPVFIFLFAMKMMKNEKAGLIAAFVYSLFPITYLKFQYGNCTDIFALFTFWLFLCSLAFSYKTLYRKTKFILPAIFLVIALLSHFSNTIFLMLFLPLMAFMAYVAYSNPKNNKRIIMFIIMILVAFMISFLIYYSHYISLIKEQAISVLHSQAAQSADDLHSKDAMFHRFSRTTGSLPLYLGMPLFLTFAVAYAAYADKRRRTTGFLFITGLLISMLAFMAISVISPLEIRWLMPLVPAISLVIGWGLARLHTIPKIKWLMIIILAVAVYIALYTIQTVMFNSNYHQIF